MKRSILFSDGSIVTYRGMHADLEAECFVNHWNASHERAKCSIVVVDATAIRSDEGTRNDARASGSFIEQNVTSV